MYPHRIRLRGPWKYEPLAPPGPAGQMTMPCRWGGGGLPGYAGRVRFLRRFGYPGTLDDYERVWLTFAGVEGTADVGLNGRPLGRHEGGDEPFEFEVTELMLARNELSVEVEAPSDAGGLWGETALEVRRTAFLRGVRVWDSSEAGVVRLHVAGEVAGVASRPLELYVVLDRSTVVYSKVDAGRTFEAVSDALEVPAAGPHLVRVELVDGATAWYTIEGAFEFRSGLPSPPSSGERGGRTRSHEGRGSSGFHVMSLLSIPQLARNANRAREVITVLSKYGLADWLSRLDLDVRGLFRRGAARNVALTTEARIRLALAELGTTFIKLGQILSTRADLIGPKLAKELSALQDGAPADPPAVARATIEAELGRPLAELFAEFDDTPLASASIGQVHRARLPDGRAVVVKVQHPNIESAVRADLDILAQLADLAEQYVPEFRQYQPRATVAEFQRTLLRELDFGREARNLEQFAVNFRGSPAVRFPAPFPALCTHRVLTMEFLDGVKLTDAGRLGERGHDLQELVRRGAGVFLDMIFRDGFYHADPHPGNLVVLPDGVIGLLDCGMVGRIDGRLREGIVDVLMAVGTRDVTRLADLVMRLGSAPPDLDEAGLCADLAEFVSYHGSRPLDHFDLGGALTEMVEIVRRYRIVLPCGVAMLIKVLVMLEGTSRLLSPQFNLSELLQPYCRKLLGRRLSPTRQLQKARDLYREWEHLAETLPRGIDDVLQQMRRGRFDVRLEHRNVGAPSNRLVLGMLTSALFVGSALLWGMKAPPLLGDVSVAGVVGCAASLALGLLLLRAVRRSGRLAP